ncbi:MAG: hypothetical protein JWM11_6371 [Planctomycetaceae bacterium]|nr:hypothetical protein [Planctomycetaceae bacterium]
MAEIWEILRIGDERNGKKLPKRGVGWMISTLDGREVN